jgi:quinone-modifying oxidoreductase, subunit QmoA
MGNVEEGGYRPGLDMPLAEKNTSVLIIGGGISGITAAVEAAETGCQVYLVEKEAFLGGQVARMNEYFPKLCPPSCGLEINFSRIRRNPRIEVICSATLEKVEGQPGALTANIIIQPEYVNSKCTICGDCEPVCPIEVKDLFNFGLSTRKTIALPHIMAFPARYHLDENSCTKEVCGKCVEACNYDAINLGAVETVREIEVGSALFCTGWQPYDTGNLEEFSFGKSPDILTNMMMERLGAPNGPTGGKILRLSDGEPARKIAFIQCAGSRDEKHLSYCSTVCCSASLKQAKYFISQDKQNRADIYYIDLRVSGRNEDFLKSVEDSEQVNLIKGKVRAVSLEGNPPRPLLEAEDILFGKKIAEEYDLVILATGIVPQKPGLDLLETDPDGFIVKDSLDQGFSAGGCCCEPKDVAASVRESTGLVLQSLQNKGG